MMRPMTGAMPWRFPATKLDLMAKNLFVSAICAGIAAGLLASALQFTFVIPVLLEGELYETGARVHFGTDGSPQSDRGAPTLARGLDRAIP